MKRTIEEINQTTPIKWVVTKLMEFLKRKKIDESTTGDKTSYLEKRLNDSCIKHHGRLPYESY